MKAEFNGLNEFDFVKFIDDGRNHWLEGMVTAVYPEQDLVQLRVNITMNTLNKLRSGA